MIRLVQRKLIIPRGDTGTFSVPVISTLNTGDVAVFTIIDMKTKRKVYEKIIDATPDTISIRFEHSDTVNLPIGRYYWDIKFYQNPEWADNELINGTEVDSYYAAYSLPECEIRLTGDNLLTADDSPTTTITPYYLNVLNATVNDVNHAKTEIAELADAAETSANNANEAATRAQEQADSIKQLSATVTMLGTNDAPTSVYNSETGVLSLGIPAPNSIFGILKTSEDGLVDTYTISYTNGTSTTFTVTNGMIPNLTIGTVQEGATAAASITGTAANPILNLTLPNANVPTRVSQLENDSNYAVDANYVHTDNNYTTAEKNKLSGIAAGAEVNVNADWNATSGDAAILNKPTNVSAFTNDAGYLTTETDPTVPAWAKAATKPTYTAAEVGAVAKTGDLMTGALSVRSGDNMVVVGKSAQTSQGSGTFISSDAIAFQWESSSGNTYRNVEIKRATPTKLQLSQNYTSGKNVVVSGIDTPVDNTDAANKGYVDEAIAQINTMNIHICAQGEYGADGVPTIQNPDTQTFYLVPGGEGNNLFIEWAYVDGAWERFGSADVDLSNYVQKTDYATKNTAGVVKINGNNGIVMLNNELAIAGANEAVVKQGTDIFRPLVSNRQHISTFYGLAKAAGDTTQSTSSNAVGIYTDEAKAAIQTMLDVPAKGDIPEVPVQDVQVNGVSVLQDGVANVPLATNTTAGVVIVDRQNASGLQFLNGKLQTFPASLSDIKGAWGTYRTISPEHQHESTFYGLSKAAGDTTQSQSANTVGNYTDTAKEKIQSMLGISQMLAPENPNLVATQAYAIGDVFAANGHLYKATAAIAQDEAIIPDTNCVETTMVDAGGKIKDVQVAGTSVVGSDGVANIAVMSSSNYGVAKINTNYGVGLYNGQLQTQIASVEGTKIGTDYYHPISPYNQHAATFYGLSKAAGVDLANETVTLGTYPETSKTAIKNMLGVQDGLKVVRLI